MARAFDGAGDKIRVSLGNCNIAGGPITLAVVIKRTSDGGWGAVITSHTSGNLARWTIEITDTNKALFGTASGTDTGSEGVGVAAADGMIFLAVTKATGTVKPRFHKYVYGTDTWTHVDTATVTLANGSAPGAGGYIEFGLWEGSDDFLGEQAMAGVYDRALADNEIEMLPFSILSWLHRNPVGLWVFDQSATGQKVHDLTGGGANESALVGTTVSAVSVPVMTYGGDIDSVLFTPAGGSAYSQSCDEVVTMVDTLIKTEGRALSEAIVLVDTLTKTGGKSLNESVTIVDTLTRTTGHVLNEVVTLVDTTIRTIGRSVSEVVTIVDAVDKTTGRIFNETITLVDTIVRTIGRSITEIVTIVDTVVKSGARSFAEVVTLADTTSNTGGKSLSETVTVVDTFAGAKVTLKNLYEVLRIFEEDEILKDDFSPNNALQSIWTNWGGGNVTLSGGFLRMTSSLGSGYYGMDLAARNFTGKSTEMEVVDAGNQSITSWGVWPIQLKFDATNNVNWSIQNGTIRATKQVAGVDTHLYEVSYDSNVHKRVRIREIAGTIYWDSFDGSSWTNRATSTNPFAVTSLVGQVFVGTWQVEGSTTYVDFDNFLIRQINRGILVTVSRSLNEATTLVDTIVRTSSRLLNETVTVVDTTTRSFGRSLSEVITLVDNIVRTGARSLFEAITLDDTFTKTGARSLTESVTLVDTTTKTGARSLEEQITVVDTEQNLFGKGLSEIITIIDTTSTVFGKVYTETITIVDSIITNFLERVAFIGTVLKQKIGSTIMRQSKNESTVMKQKP